MNQIWKQVEFKKGADGLTILEAWSKINDQCYLFIAIRKHHQAEAFGIDLGWNKMMEQPYPPYEDERFFDFSGSSVEMSANNVSLKLLSDGNDSIWEIINSDSLAINPNLLLKSLTETSAMEEVEPIFNEAISTLENVGLPYLQKVASHNR